MPPSSSTTRRKPPGRPQVLPDLVTFAFGVPKERWGQLPQGGGPLRVLRGGRARPMVDAAALSGAAAAVGMS